MAHGDRAKKNGNGNREYWGRRPTKYKFADHGKETKNNTHRLERRKGRSECKDGSVE